MDENQRGTTATPCHDSCFKAGIAPGLRSIRPAGLAPDGQRQPLRGRRRPPSAHDHLFTGKWIFDLSIDSLLTRYASVTAPASKGQVPRQSYAAFGLSIDTLWTQGASKGRSLRRFMLQLHPKGGRHDTP